MIKTLLFISLILMEFISQNCYAQIGWQWVAAGKAIGINGETEFWGKIAVDDSGNVYETNISPWFDSAVFGTFKILNPQVLCQIIVTKTNSTGNFLWAIGTLHSNAIPISIAPDKYGNLYLLGVYYGGNLKIGTKSVNTSPAANSYFLAKISAQGTVIWAKNVGNYSITTPTHDAEDEFLNCRGGLGIDTFGDIFVTGSFCDAYLAVDTIRISNFDTIPDPFWGTYSFDIFLENFDTSGSIKWVKTFGDIYDDFSYLLSATPNGNVLIQGDIGYCTTPNFCDGLLSNTGYLARFDRFGNCLMARDYGITVFDMTTDPDNNIYILSAMDSILTLGTTTLTSNGSSDVLVIKYDSLLQVLWANSGGGVLPDEAYGITVDACQNVFVCGEMGMNPGPNMTPGYTMNFNEHILSQVSDSCCDPMFVVEYDNAGNYQNSLALTTGGDDVNGITVDNKGSFYVGADYISLQPWIIGNDTLNPTDGSEYSIIAKFRYDSLGCSIYHWTDETNSLPIPFRNNIIISPNPVQTELTISSSTLITNITITNLLGQKLYAHEYSEKNVQIDVANLPAGMYLVQVNGTEVRKFVKE